MYLRAMHRIAIVFTICLTTFTFAQSTEYTWESIHQDHINWVEGQNYRAKYRSLIRREYTTEEYVRKRLRIAWHLGKMDDIYQYVPKLFKYLENKDSDEVREILYRTIEIDKVALTEWRRNGEMLKLVLNRFKDHRKIQEYLTPPLLYIEYVTGQTSTGVPRAKNYLETCQDSVNRSRIMEVYLRLLHEDNDVDAALAKSKEFYEETGEAKYLESYCSAVFTKGDRVAYLLLEDTIRKHGFYFHYFNLMSVHIERGDSEAMEYYLNWFEDSLTVDKWSQAFEMENEDMTYVFSSEQIKLVADYLRPINPVKACELYAQILKTEEKTFDSEWKKKKDAEYFLAKVGTKNEEAYMELWARVRAFRSQLIQECTTETELCE